MFLWTASTERSDCLRSRSTTTYATGDPMSLLPFLPRMTAALLGLLLTGSTPGLAAAPTSTEEPVVTTTTLSDPDDTQGPLDVAAVAHRVSERTGTALLRYTVRLHEPVDARGLHRRHRLLVAELDTDGRPGSERNVTVYARDGELRADLISNATREVIRSLQVGVVGEHRLQVRAARELIGARRIFWYSYFHRTGHPDCGWEEGHPVTCGDSVPDDGWLRLPRAAWPGDGGSG